MKRVVKSVYLLLSLLATVTAVASATVWCGYQPELPKALRD
jgi:cyclic lactone autoinducer peptide